MLYVFQGHYHTLHVVYLTWVRLQWKRNWYPSYVQLHFDHVFRGLLTRVIKAPLI